MCDTVKIRRALLSVSDKSGVDILAKTLHDLGIEILSTGGTAKLLEEQGIPVIQVSDYTGFPEIMGGRVKTLHPRIHGGILARRDLDADVMKDMNIQPIDLVVVNLYPFRQTIAQSDCTLEKAIENIDIGGPAMIRSAAKNHAFVTVLTDPSDYAEFAKELSRSQGQVSLAMRQRLAAKAFTHTASYDIAISNYLNEHCHAEECDTRHSAKFPQILLEEHHLKQILRYGENPHQEAAFYQSLHCSGTNIANASQLQGKELSYNNIADSDTALQMAMSFEQDPSCVIIKHANPCGVASAGTALEAYEAAFRCDPSSAFGGIIAFNRAVDEKTAEAIINRQFLEVLIAPEFSEEARRVLAKKPNVRVLSVPFYLHTLTSLQHHSVGGGLLLQDADNGVIDRADLQVVSDREPTHDELRDLLFAWKVVKFTKSNAIVIAKNLATIGIGAGQSSRVYSSRIAARKALDEGLDTQNCALASDAFFPFRDGVDKAAEIGVSAIIQPGGSIRDKEVLAAVNEYKMAMIFTGMRHFRH